MTTATAIESAEMRIAMTRKQAIGRVLGIILLLGVAVWLIVNLVSAPSQFFNSLLFGAGNGALYALIALGYTLVYGIIELINFAHGDLFMLATIFSGVMMVNVFGAVEPSAQSWALMLVTLVAAMVSVPSSTWSSREWPIGA
jgi:branched-chain amino acid transport system permease protein